MVLTTSTFMLCFTFLGKGSEVVRALEFLDFPSNRCGFASYLFKMLNRSNLLSL
jgi:hypothetical protein